MARVLFMHPDLGIGGAERLVVDAAMALHKENHWVKFVTNHHDPEHCFTETKQILPVTVVGDWLPRSIFGKFTALCAYIRFMFAALYVVIFEHKVDVIFTDSISCIVPILRLFTNSKIIYYCHFPDLLLSQPGGILKQIYRMPLNFAEEYSISFAHKTLVNSEFTASVFLNTFTSLQALTIEVLYPSIFTAYFDSCYPVKLNEFCKDIPKNATIFLSINRYERKKNLPLALKAFAILKKMLSDQEFSSMYLIMAGGYDNRVSENVEHYQELVDIALNLEIAAKVKFLKSPTDLQKVALIQNSCCLVYTPSNEHFGIVPLEAMYCSKPVIACNSGGPTETVIDQITGLLSEPNEKDFATCMSKIVLNQDIAEKMGRNGKRRFSEKFSFEAFQNKLITVIVTLLENAKTD